MQKRRMVAGVLVLVMALSVCGVIKPAEAARKTLVLKTGKGLKKKSKSGSYSLSMEKGNRYQIRTTAKKTAYSSSAKKIASVNKKGVITAKKVGKATIRIQSGKGKKQKKCTIAVTVKAKQDKNQGKVTPQPTAPANSVAPTQPVVTANPTGTPSATASPDTVPPVDTPSAKPTQKPTPTPKPTPTAKPDYELEPTKYTTLTELAQKNGFQIGTVVNPWILNNEKFTELVKYHFNSITASNEMKAYSLLNQKMSEQAYVDADSAPVLDYTNADIVMDFAKENGIAVRGHTLVWDASMSDWFFREGYKKDGEYVDQETMRKRMQSYIEQVILHFEEKYPGVIYCWDVVNEAVDNGKPMDKEDPRCIEKNVFSEHAGSDYVELAFQYTYEAIQKVKETIEPDVDIKLFYNDFSTFYEGKRNAICALVKSINEYMPDGEGGFVKLCDGVGMQSYIGGYGYQSGCMNDNDLNLIRDSILAFHALGVEVHVTELAVRNYQVNENEKHGTFYGKLFQLYRDLNAGEDKPITSVSIWGLMDNPTMSTNDYSYKMNGPYCGIFNENYEVKPSFRAAYFALGGE